MFNGKLKKNKIKKPEGRGCIELNGYSLNPTLVSVSFKIIVEGYGSYDLRKPELRTNDSTCMLVTCFPGSG